MPRKMPLFSLLLMLSLFACDWSTPALPPPLFTPAAPSGTPAIQSATPVIITSTSLAAGMTSEASATATEAASATPAPTATTALPELDVQILGCNTGLDLLHQMGEVTNALVVIRNRGSGAATNVCAALAASDEDRAHPNKTGCIPRLDGGYQVAFKLTVDTGYKQDTSIKVTVGSEEGASAAVDAQSCRDVGMPGSDPNSLGTAGPIP